MTDSTDVRTAESGAVHEIDPDLAAELEYPSEEALAEAGLVAPEITARGGIEGLEALLPRGIPDRFLTPIWWRCLRLGAVSGRYEGGMVAPTPDGMELDLRVDIDPRSINSPILEKISGDLYKVFSFNWIGRTFRWRYYQRSFIIDSPRIVWSRCKVTASGRVRFWRGGQPVTNLELEIPWGTFRPAGRAQVKFTTSDGDISEYVCARKSGAFRTLGIEVDVTDSANGAPVLPTYNTHAHNTRPVDMIERDLTFEGAYRESGVDVTLKPSGAVVDDSDPEFATWNEDELDDAMATHFQQSQGGWPKWEMWGLLCGKFRRLTTAGIMFDYRTSPQRQGFAVFRDHSWFNSLPAGAPANQTEAYALRQFIYTWVHEAGHAFNFRHSWDKGRPSALSWMNYPQYVTDFWQDFEFRFDDEELEHLRHGDRNAVIMGAEDWGTGPEIGIADGIGAIEGAVPLEFTIRSDNYFEFMDDVRIELRLLNKLSDMDIPIDTRLNPRHGIVAIYIIGPDGKTRQFEPAVTELGEPRPMILKSKGSTRGLDRYSVEVPIGFGRTGHNFTTPGTYEIRAIYLGAGDILIPAASKTIRVGYPVSTEMDRLAQDYFSFDAGLCLALGGSRAKHLRSGRATLEKVADIGADTLLGARISEVLADSLSRPFFTIDRKIGRVIKLSDADPKEALRFSNQALKTVKAKHQPVLNIAYSAIACKNATLLSQTGKKTEAKKVVATLKTALKKHGVNAPVLEDIEAFAMEL